MCKLECPSFSGRPKESHVFVRRSSLLVSRSVFWSDTSLIFFHKTPKDPNSPLKEDRDSYRNLFGRHADYWQNKGRDYSSTRYSHSFTSVTAICYKSQKVSVSTCSGDTISGMIASSKEVAWHQQFSSFSQQSNIAVFPNSKKFSY